MDDFTTKLAEHLRLVHFTLVVVAVTLLIATIERGEGPQEDLDSIVNLVDAFKPEAVKYRSFEAGILERQIRELFPKKPFTKPYAGTLQITDKSRNLLIDVDLNFYLPIATVFHSESTSEWSGLRGESGAYSDFFFGPPDYRPIAPSIPDEQERLRNPMVASGPWKAFERPPATIGQYQKFWDACAKMRHAYIFESVHEPKAFLVTAQEGPGARNIRELSSPLRNAPKFNPENRFLVPLSTEWAVVQDDPDGSRSDDVFAKPEILTIDHTWANVGLGEFTRRLLAILRPESSGYSQVSKFEEMKPGDVLVTAITNYRHNAVNLQEHLLFLTHDEKRQRGSFERSYPEIQKFLTDLGHDGEMGYELLNAILAREERRSGSSLEFAGLKIARSSIRIWGVAVLVAIQLYFYLHLREFTTRSRKGDEALKVAWIGLYPGLGSLFVFSMSIVALPAIVSGLIVWNQLGSQNLSIVNVILCVFSISIAFAATRLVKALRYLVNNAN